MPKKKISATEHPDARRAGDPVLGAIIKAARLVKDLTQDQLADLVGATKAAVSQWESGTNHIKDENRRALSVALDIPLEVMFRVSEGSVLLTPKERLLIERFRQLLPGTQEAFLLIVTSYGANDPKKDD